MSDKGVRANCCQKQIKMDYLEKLISIAETDLGVDIKKNSNTPQSTGLGQINRP